MSEISKNVMQLHEFEGSVWYRLVCQCGSPRCDLTIELENDRDVSSVYLNFYKHLAWSSYWGDDNKWYKNFWLRIKCSLRVLFTGYVKVEESFLMQEEQIDGFIQALKEGREKLEGQEQCK